MYTNSSRSYLKMASGTPRRTNGTPWRTGGTPTAEYSSALIVDLGAIDFTHGDILVRGDCLNANLIRVMNDAVQYRIS